MRVEELTLGQQGYILPWAINLYEDKTAFVKFSESVSLTREHTQNILIRMNDGSIDVIGVYQLLAYMEYSDLPINDMDAKDSAINTCDVIPIRNLTDDWDLIFPQTT